MIGDVVMMPKKRTIAGGLIVIGIGIGSYFNGLIPNFGGTGIGLNVDSKDSTDSSDSNPVTSDKQFEVPKIVDVIIDGYGFAILQVGDGNPSYHQIELEKLIDLAKRAPGDADLGIKVQVSQTKTARVSAENKLKDALASAGLSDDEIHWKTEMVDQPDLH